MATLLRKQWRQKPPESWQINWGHPLADGLVSFITADGDHVSGAPLVLMGSGRRQGDGTFYSPGGSSDGAYVPFAPRLFDIGTDYTCVCFLTRANQSNYSTVLGVPYAGGSWSSPWMALSLQRYYNTTRLRTMWSGLAASSGGDGSYGALNMWPGENVYSCIAAGKTTSKLFFYSNNSYSEVYSLDDSEQLTSVPYFGNKQPIHIANHSHASPGEPTGGVFLPAIIFSRALTSDELLSVNENPWQVFQPHRFYCILSATTAPSVAAAVATARLRPSMGSTEALAAGSGSPCAALISMTAQAPVSDARVKGSGAAVVMATVPKNATAQAMALPEASPATCGLRDDAAVSVLATVLADALPALFGATQGEHAGMAVAVVAPDACHASLVARAVAMAVATSAGASASVLRLLARSLLGETGVREAARLASPVTTAVRRASPLPVAIRRASPIETEQA